MARIQWFERYNTWHPHQALDNRTPHQVHEEDDPVSRPVKTDAQEAA